MIKHTEATRMEIKFDSRPKKIKGSIKKKKRNQSTNFFPVTAAIVHLIINHTQKCSTFTVFTFWAFAVRDDHPTQGSFVEGAVVKCQRCQN